MELKQTLAALAVAATCASMNANAVIQLDTDGNGMIAGSDIIAGIDWSPSNLVFDEGAGASNTTASLLGHGHKFEASLGVTFTYQFDITVDSSRVDQFSRDVFDTGVGTFKLFMDSGMGDIDQAAGTGYGTLNGATGSTTGDQVELLSGDVTIAGLGFSIDSTRPSGAELTPAWLSENNTIGDIATLFMGGSFSLLVDVLTQDDDFVVNDMVNADLQFDLNLITLGPLSPFDPMVPASEDVAGSGPLNYGDDEALVGIVDPLTLLPDAVPAGVVPLNDFNCFGQGILATCDAQFQTSGNTVFQGAAVPEPGTLAMLGLGLGLFGASRRRKAQA